MCSYIHEQAFHLLVIYSSESLNHSTNSSQSSGASSDPQRTSVFPLCSLTILILQTHGIPKASYFVSIDQFFTGSFRRYNPLKLSHSYSKLQVTFFFPSTSETAQNSGPPMAFGDLMGWTHTDVHYLTRFFPLQASWCPTRSSIQPGRRLVCRSGVLRTWTSSLFPRTSMEASTPETPTSCCTPQLHHPTTSTCGWVSAIMFLQMFSFGRSDLR